MTKGVAERDEFGQWPQDVDRVTAEMLQYSNVMTSRTALRCCSKSHCIQPTVGLWVICKHQQKQRCVLSISSFVRLWGSARGTAEHFYVSTVCTSLTAWRVGSWSVMVLLVPSINVILSWIFLSYSWPFAVNFISESMYRYLDGRGKISSLWKKLLHEFLCFASSALLIISLT